MTTVDPLQAALTVSGSGLQAQSQRVLVATENLANLNSTGRTPGADPYTRKLIAFEPDFDRELGASMVKAGDISLDRKTPYPIQKDPGNPAANAAGYVKFPNVDMLVEMADIREANRSYQANLQVIKQARDLITMTIDLLKT
jgi:flagellar basal-body rod protein FlgC